MSYTHESGEIETFSALSFAPLRRGPTPAIERFAIADDRERGELEVLRTYPLPRGTYVAGVYLDRLAGLLLTLLVPLLLAGLAVPLAGGAGTYLPQPAGLDSPVFYLRSVVLSGAYGAVVLGVMTLLSAVAHSNSRDVVGAIALVLALALGVDVATVVGIATVGRSFASVVVLSPNGAYRGLVLALVVEPISTTPLAPVAPLLSAITLTS